MTALSLWLAEAAAAELAQRRRLRERLKAKGEAPPAGLAGDIAAWAAIAELLETGSCDAGALEAQAGDTSLPSAWWAVLERAAARALDARAAAAAASPGEPRKAERRDAVRSIHARLVHCRALAAMRPGGTARAA